MEEFSAPIHLNDILPNATRSPPFLAIAKFVDAAVWRAGTTAIDAIEDEEEGMYEPVMPN